MQPEYAFFLGAFSNAAKEVVGGELPFFVFDGNSFFNGANKGKKEWLRIYGHILCKEEYILAMLRDDHTLFVDE